MQVDLTQSDPSDVYTNRREIVVRRRVFNNRSHYANHCAKKEKTGIGLPVGCFKLLCETSIANIAKT